MEGGRVPEARLRLAEDVRAACLAAMREAYDQAAMSGLCCEGAFECAVGAIETLDLEPFVRAAQGQTADEAGEVRR